MSRRLRILTWHVHGNYLYSLTQLPHDFIVPVLPDNPPGYGALGPALPWGSNVTAVPAWQVRSLQFDCVIYQSRAAFLHDRALLMSARQQALPCVFIEHNPPEPHATDARHFFQHDNGVLVHVTHYNALMWEAQDVPVAVIEHGVPEMAAWADAGVHGSTQTSGIADTSTLNTHASHAAEANNMGSRNRGIAVINNLGSRGRRLGADIYQWARGRIPLDLIGMNSTAFEGGLGEVPNRDVQPFLAQYRFFFTPVRYASLGLSVIEAMLAGLPVVGIAATELNAVIRNGENGYVDTRPTRLVEVAQQLLNDRDMALRWGQAARQTARTRFGIQRFVNDWQQLLLPLTEKHHA